MRPRQWSKNLLVVVAPLGAGRLFEIQVLAATLAAFAAFSLAASATYLVNDGIDIERDRAHPSKRNRPLASGALPVRAALAVAVGLGAGSLAIGFFTSMSLGWVLVTYLGVTLAYSIHFKHAPVLELALLALGFLLRAVGGGAASDIPISSWFLLVAGFGSLFMAAGKRFAELNRLLESGANVTVRGSLAGYSLGYLRFVWTTAAAVTITTYCLWAVEVGANSSIPWAMMSIVPFSLGILRYAVDIDRGSGEAPEEVVVSDASLAILGVAWVIPFGLGALGIG